MKCGILFRKGSLWIGVHWSKGNRRLCINLIPCVTFWITLKYGNVPGSTVDVVKWTRDEYRKPFFPKDRPTQTRRKVTDLFDF